MAVKVAFEVRPNVRVITEASGLLLDAREWSHRAVWCQEAFVPGRLSPHVVTQMPTGIIARAPLSHHAFLLFFTNAVIINMLCGWFRDNMKGYVC